VKTNYRDNANCCANCKHSISDFDFQTYCNQNESAVWSKWMKDKEWQNNHMISETGVCDDFMPYSYESTISYEGE